MSNLIDTTYFINELAVAQVDYAPVNAVLTDLISKYEPFYLSAILGNALHKEFKTGLEADPIEQRWLDLLNGVEFMDSAGNAWYWPGFVNDEKISPIANYVYFYWLRKEAQLTTGAGEAALQTENAVRKGAIAKQVHIWNQMTDLNYSLLKFLLHDAESFGPLRCTCLKDNLLTKINEFSL